MLPVFGNIYLLGMCLFECGSFYTNVVLLAGPPQWPTFPHHTDLEPHWPALHYNLPHCVYAMTVSNAAALCVGLWWACQPSAPRIVRCVLMVVICILAFERQKLMGEGGGGIVEDLSMVSSSIKIATITAPISQF